MSGVGTSTAVWQQIEKNKNGYTQNAKLRWSSVLKWFNGTALSTVDALATIAKNKEVDCSAAWAIGVDLAYGTTFHKTGCSTRNIAKLAKDSGYFRVVRYDNNKSPQAQGKPGGAFLTPGHHVVSLLDDNLCLNAVANERGTTTGGKPGDQTGREVRIDKWYKRPGGWVYNIIPISANEFKGKVLAQYASGKQGTDTLKKLNVVASSDGPLYIRFLNEWSKLNAGFTVGYAPSDLQDIPAAKHVFVVLGSALNSDGTLTKKYIRRLMLARDAYNAFPNSCILVSGGKPYNGITEGEAGMEWLVKNGVPSNRILTEEKSSSTIGNALYSVPIIKDKGFTSCTLISDESHLRRAGVLFLASELKIETAGVGAHPFPLTFLRPLAYKDKEVASHRADDATRYEIGREAAMLLGLSNYFKA